MDVLGRIFTDIRKHTALLIVLFILISLGAIAGTYLGDQIYESRAKLVVGFDTRPISVSRSELPSESPGVLVVEAVTTFAEHLATTDIAAQVVEVLGPEAFEGPPPTNPFVRRISETINSLSSWLRGHLLAVGLIEDMPARDALIENVRDSLSVFPVRQSQVIEISFQWDVATVPPVVVNHLLGIYRERLAEFNAQAAQEEILFNEAENAARRLNDAQQTLARLRADTGIEDPAARRSHLIARLLTFESLLDGGGSAGVATSENAISGEIAQLQRNLSTLRIERASALAELTESSPRVVEIAARLAATEEELARALARVTAATERDRRELGRVTAAEAQFGAAMREIDLANEALRTYSQAADDRRVMRLGEQEVRMRVISGPLDRASLSGPGRLSVLVGGLLFALLASVAIVLLIEQRAKRLRAEATATESRADRQFRLHVG